MKSIAIVFVTIFFGISFAIPIKDHDIDELVLRVNELRRLNPYQDDMRNMFYVRNLDSIGGGNLIRTLNTENIGEKQELYRRNPLGKHIDNVIAASGLRRDYYPGDGSGGNLNISPFTQRIVRSLDSLGGGNLIRALDSIGGGHLVKRTIDSLGGANLLKK